MAQEVRSSEKCSSNSEKVGPTDALGGNLSLISNNPLQRPNNGNNKLLFIDMDNRYIINLI